MRLQLARSRRAAEPVIVPLPDPPMPALAVRGESEGLPDLARAGRCRLRRRNGQRDVMTRFELQLAQLTV